MGLLTPKKDIAGKVSYKCVEHEINSNNASCGDAVPEDEVTATLLEVVVRLGEYEGHDSRDQADGSHDDAGGEVGISMTHAQDWAIRTQRSTHDCA